MSFGLQTWGATGALELDTGNFTYQVIHNVLYQLTMNQVLSVSIPEFNPATCVASILPTQAATAELASQAMPYVSVSSGNVTVRSRNPSEPSTTIGSTIQFRLLVMRFS